jgi:hypothetical protein
VELHVCRGCAILHTQPSLRTFELQSKLPSFLQYKHWNTNQAYHLLHQLLTATLKTVCWLVGVLCLIVLNFTQFWCDFNLLSWCRLELCSFGLLGFYTVSSCNLLPKFRDNLSVPSSRVKIQEEVQFCLYHRPETGKQILILGQMISYFILFIISILLFCILCQISVGDLCPVFQKGPTPPSGPLTLHDGECIDTLCYHWWIRALNALCNGCTASGWWNAFFTTCQKSSSILWYKESLAIIRLPEEVMQCLPYWHIYYNSSNPYETLHAHVGNTQFP